MAREWTRLGKADVTRITYLNGEITGTKTIRRVIYQRCDGVPHVMDGGDYRRIHPAIGGGWTLVTKVSIIQPSPSLAFTNLRSALEKRFLK